MKKAIFAAMLIALCVAAFAAREPLETISADPYASAIVLDAETGEVLFEENADAKVYPASIVKLMGMLLILEGLQEGRLTLSDPVYVTAEASTMGGSQVYLKEGETFPLEDMLYALCIKSANDVAVALALHIAGSKQNFVDLMNKRATELELASTVFASVHGLPPEEGQDVDVSTARDVAKLSMALLKHPAVLRYTSTQERWFRNNTFQMLSHNRLLKDVEGCDGLKTGYFRAAGFSISATASRNGRRVIAVVMGSKVRQVRDDKARELLAYGFLHLPERAPQAAATVAAPAPAAADPGVVEKRGSFGAGFMKVIAFLGKCILFLLLVVLVCALVVGLVFVFRRYRERWKYRF